MEIHIDPRRKQVLDDQFDVLTMLAGGNLVSIYDVESQVTRYGAAAVDLFQLPGEYIPAGAMDWGDKVHPEDRKLYYDIMAKLVPCETLTYDLSYRVRTKDGGYSLFRAIGGVLRDGEGKASLIGGMMVNQGLMENTDPVTAMPNKYAFFDDLDFLMKSERSTVTLLLGIRQLGHINETYGYTYGNRVLQEMAALIQMQAGEHDRVYRMDDAAFAVVSETRSRDEMAALYDTLRMKLQRGLQIDGVRNILRANGGMLSTSTLKTDPATVSSCLAYAYKESKYNRHGELVDFNGSINYELRESLELVNIIRDCILDDCRGFSVKYQPVFRADSEKLIGVEGLVRWSDEQYGEVEPLKFIPVLEQDFVFEELGRWMLGQVATDGVKFLEKAPWLKIGLNISSAQLCDEYFVDGVLQTLQQTGLPAENLAIELTKDCRLLEEKLVHDVVEALHKRQITVVIDDFGTGNESLGFLKSLSADFIKFDRALTGDVLTDERAQQTLAYLSRLSTLCGTHVCVKGVESQEMHDVLKDFDVRSLQGNYYSPPVPAEELLEKFLK